MQPVYSEYAITFCEQKSLLNFILSKGYLPTEIHNLHFPYNPFENYKSHLLDFRHFGVCVSDRGTHTISFMPEKRFIEINKFLNEVLTPEIFTNAMSREKQIYILKHGVAIIKNGCNKFSIRDDRNGTSLSFNLVAFSKGDLSNFRWCRLELVKIFESEEIGWINVCSSS